MKGAIRAALPALALLAVMGCGSSSSDPDSCAKACDKLVACAASLGTTIDVLVDQDGVTPSNCAAGCRDQMKYDCEDPEAFFACIGPLTCPAPGPDAIPDVQDALLACQDSACWGVPTAP